MLLGLRDRVVRRLGSSLLRIWRRRKLEQGRRRLLEEEKPSYSVVVWGMKIKRLEIVGKWDLLADCRRLLNLPTIGILVSQPWC